jgi:glycosyltransferase involved in cell wall biosynthesis
VSTPARQTLSIAIVAKNEEANLRRILPTIAPWADEIVLVDSGSSDETVAVAESFGARVLHQEWLGFGPQKNFAIDQCTSEWVLSLDADEEPSSELVALLPEVITKSSPDLAGFTLARRNYFLGRPMRHGGMYPDRKLRLFRRGQAHFQHRSVHESMLANGPVAKLAGDLHHHSYPTLTLYIEHMNRYSSASIPLLLGRGKRSLSFPAFVWNIVANPLATFAYNYILRGGFLDGREGLLLHLYHSVYVSWKYVKAWEQAHDGAI